MGRFTFWVLFGLTLFAVSFNEINANADVRPSEYECRPYIEKAINELKSGEPSDKESLPSPDEGLTNNQSEHDDDAAEVNDNVPGSEEMQSDQPADDSKDDEVDDDNDNDNDKENVEIADAEESDEESEKPTVADIDTDGDGIPNEEDADIDGDAKPNDEDEDMDGDGILNIHDDDIDGDVIPNENDPDIDGDGVLNVHDDDIDGDGIDNDSDKDIDGDGVSNINDNDLDGDGIPNDEDDDMDGDGIPNDQDDDIDGDGIPNEDDDDIDGDGVLNEHDGDIDGDGTPNSEDDDIDGDGIPNHKDEDIDGDGVSNEEDNDIDGDGVPNENDHDLDGDGVPNAEDTDMDGDGIPNEKDHDVDGDGMPNTEEPKSLDIDGDGIPNDDDSDIDGDLKINENDEDMDGDGILNVHDLDIDGDGVPNVHDEDSQEISAIQAEKRTKEETQEENVEVESEEVDVEKKEEDDEVVVKRAKRNSEAEAAPIEKAEEGEEGDEDGDGIPDEHDADSADVVEQQEEKTADDDDDIKPEDELLWEGEIPQTLRSRVHIGELLQLDEESNAREQAVDNVAEIILRDIKRIYENAIKPLETLYKYRDLSNRHFGDPEIFSKPLILFMGPWSGGKSSTINYLTNNEYTPTSLRTGAEPSPAYFNILMWGNETEVLDGTQLAADYTFSGLQKFGEGLEERLRGLKLNSKLLEKVNIVEIPGILEVRKQVSRLFPFNDACQWFIDRADIIFLVYDPAKLDVGPETEAILDQLKGREYQTRIVLNKADTVKPEELLRVQSALIWNISPLMSSAQPPLVYTTSLWSHPYQDGAPARLLLAQERAFLRDLRTAIDKRIEHKIASARRFAVRVRNHAKMVDCYLNTFYNHKTLFGNKKRIADNIIEHPQNYHIYEGLSTLTNISRYDLPDPEVYRDFFRLNPLYEFKKLAETCTYFRGCPITKLDVAIAYDLPELAGKYKKMTEAALVKLDAKENVNEVKGKSNS